MELVLFVGLGLLAGTLGGLLGIGGSVIMIPALLFFIPEMTIHLAQAVAMSVNPAVAISAAAKHHRNKNVSWHTAMCVMPLSIIFISVAAWFSNSIDGAMLEFGFALFLIWVLWDQISCLTIKPSSKESCNDKASVNRLALTGGITGAVSGLLGIGGATLFVPFLIRNNIPAKLAIGTASALGFLIGLGASISIFISSLYFDPINNYMFGFVYLPAIFFLTLPSLIFVQLSANWLLKISDANIKKLFSSMLLIIGLLMLFN